MKYIISILLLFFPHFFNAQTSKEILSNLSKKTKSYKSVTFDFTSTLKIPKSGSTQINKGSAKIKGTSSLITLGDYIIVSDGKTVWNYNKSNNEVVIDNFEDVKDDWFNPIELFKLWEKDVKHELKNKNSVIGGVTCYQILLTVNWKKSQNEITLWIDKSKGEIVRLEINSKNTIITYDIKSFKSNIDIPDSQFYFDKNKFPGVIEIDNRI